MKRSYEDRVQMSGKNRRRAQKPSHNNFGIHKTKRHFMKSLEDRFIDREMAEELEDPNVLALLDEYEG